MHSRAWLNTQKSLFIEWTSCLVLDEEETDCVYHSSGSLRNYYFFEYNF